MQYRFFMNNILYLINKAYLVLTLNSCLLIDYYILLAKFNDGQVEFISLVVIMKVAGTGGHGVLTY